MRFALAAVLHLAAVLPACTCGERGPSESPACKTGDEIDGSTLDAVEDEARRIVRLVRDGEIDAAWNSLHPVVRTDKFRSSFITSLHGVTPRLVGAPDQPEVADARLIEDRSGRPTVTRITCGPSEPSDPGHATVRATTGGGRVAFVTLAVPGQPFAHAVLVELKQHGETWRLMGINASPSHYRGKDAAEYERIGDAYFAAGKYLPAYLLVGLARSLSDRGASFSTGQRERVDARLLALRSSPELAPHLGQWPVDGHTIRIHDVGLISALAEISPWIKYVTDGPLRREHVEPEAARMREHMRARYPELAQHFDAVLFEAFAVAPTDPARQYQSYRAPVSLTGDGAG